MQEQRSKVNFRKLVQDLASMYGDDTFDVVVSELVANSLDAKPSQISIDWDEKKRILVVTDDGIGMDSNAFEQYHDFAAELKTRGDGIGFAGVGAKISFNVASMVITETRHKGKGSASDWRWGSDGSLIWNRVKSNKLQTDGTRVEVHFEPGEFLLDVDDAYLLAVLKKQYLPLFITDFLRAYESIGMYQIRPKFTLNGSPLLAEDLVSVAGLTKVERLQLKSGTSDIGWGAIGVAQQDRPIGGSDYGVLLCTYGKVVKPELFGLSTGLLGTKLFGIVEIPGLIQYLTTNKAGLKGGPGRTPGLNRLLDPVREELRDFLAKHGVSVAEPQRNQLSAKLERELTKIVRQLPELRDFNGLLGRTQRLRKSDTGDIPTSPDRDSGGTGAVKSEVNDTGGNGAGSGGTSRKRDSNGRTPANRQRSRNSQGPRVAFEDHTDRDETAWLDSNTIVINSGHAAYRQRVNQDQARLTYCMFAIGIALDKAELSEPGDGVSYVDKFITAWGQS